VLSIDILFVPEQEIDKEASAVFLDVQSETGHQTKRNQDVVLDEVLGDPNDVVKTAKANIKKAENREVRELTLLSFALWQYFHETMTDSFHFLGGK